MSNLEFLGICCIAFVCVVSMVILGMLILYCCVFHFFIFIKKVIGKFQEKVKTILIKLKNKIWSHKVFYGKITIFTIILLAGIVTQIFIENNMFPRPIYVDNLNNISIAVVTIQATLFTLVVALLALVTNNDKIYFGFEIKDFYFKHCTVFLEQKTMMFFGIDLILLNTMFLYFDLHNMIYAVFLISLGFIVESAKNVMRIFAGKDEDYTEDVKDYIYECLEKNRTVKDIYDNFTNDWCKKIRNHDSYNEKLYFEIHCKIRMHMIKNR